MELDGLWTVDRRLLAILSKRLLHIIDQIIDML